MKKLINPYLIAFAGLKNGEYNFEYIIDDSFFKDREYSEIQKALIKTDILLAKESQLLVFNIKMEGTINVMCDRCGDPFDVLVWGEKKLIITLTNNSFEDEEDIASLPLDASEIDLSPYLYEYISLLLPLRRVHPNIEKGIDTCNEESLKLLEKFSTKEKETATDPRWDALLKIKKDKKTNN